MGEVLTRKKNGVLFCICAIIANVQTCLNTATTTPKLCPPRVECDGKNLETVHVDCKGKNRIRALHLEENHIGEMGGDVFEGMIRLEELRLENNRIGNLPEDLLDDLENLRELYLYSNEIRIVNDRIFKATENLTTLSLQYNRIRRVPASTFKNLKYLSNLSLEANGIKTIDRNAFPRNNSMRRLYCYDNFIIDVRFLEPLKQLDYLDLSGNQIEIIPAGIFLNFTDLNWLLLNENGISELAFLENTLELRHLELAHNQIRTAPIDRFNRLKKLEYLSLSHNRIESVRSGSFSELENLETLDLSHNLLVMFGEVLRSLPRLRFLQINDNLLESMVVTERVQNVTISVGNNKWKCEFVRNLFAFERIELRYSYNASVSHLSGLPCTDAHEDTIENNTEEKGNLSKDLLLYVLLASCVLLFIVGLIAVVLKIRSSRKKRKNLELALKSVARSEGGYMTPIPACQNIYEEIHDVASIIRPSDSCTDCTINNTI